VNSASPTEWAKSKRMTRLRRFLPPQVADLIVASGSEKQLESHCREVTALFCDLRGFTGFTESADAEDVMALLRDYHAVIGERHAELFEPVRNLLHRGPGSGEFAVAQLSFWNRTTERLYDKSPAQYRASGARRSCPAFLIIVNVPWWFYEPDCRADRRFRRAGQLRIDGA
jgi:hypothetical protein